MIGIAPGSDCVVRGGCWGSARWDIQAAHRARVAPGVRGNLLGVRLARRAP